MKRLARLLLCLALFALLAGGTVFAAEKTGSLGVVTAEDSVILRAKATTDSKALDKIPHDEQFVIIGSSGSFFKVEYDGEVGYVSDKFAVKLSSKTGYSTVDELNLREKASSDSDILGAIDKGEMVRIYGSKDNFYLVVAGQTRCYVAKKYITTKKPSTKSSSDEEKNGKEEEEEAPEESVFDPNSTEYFVENPGEYTEDELYLAAKLIYSEGKNQSDESYQAMASLLYNRVMSKKFPDTIEGNVYMEDQFSPVSNREKFEALEPSKRAILAVFKVFVEGKVTLPEDVMFFKSGSLPRKWGKREYYDTIGGNMYYK